MTILVKFRLMTQKPTPTILSQSTGPPPSAVDALTDNPSALCPVEDIDLPSEFEFTPVPRRYHANKNSITADKQRAFILALAQTGSVALASKVIGNAGGSLYSLKLAAGAESFAAAWDKAIHRGAGQILDILVDHAINGAPEYIYKEGVLVAERRVFNYRMMMWIVAHHMPERFGMPSGLTAYGGSSKAVDRMKAAWRTQWEEERAGADQATQEETNAEILKRLKPLHKRNWYKMYVPWMDDPEKRAACEVLYGEQNWDAIRAASEKAARKGAFSPEQLEQMGLKGLG
jgi:hypothetical protein